MSDANLAEFRKDDGASFARVDETPVAVDSDVLDLPEMRVSERRDPEPLDAADVAVPTEAIPLKFRTGITEVRGRKFTVATQRILFIPLGFKLSW